MKILFASSNKHKIHEVKKIFSNLTNIDFITLDNLGDNNDAEENGKSFHENAYIKAKYFYDKYKIPTFSDDSGLCVEYLNGAPGIFSARFSGIRNDNLNNQKLLDLLKGVNNRKAYYTCVICYIDEEGYSNYFEGKLYGKINESLIGENGFGYDPLFYLGEYNKTLSELDENMKNQISHRKIALDKFNEFLIRRTYGKFNNK